MSSFQRVPFGRATAVAAFTALLASTHAQFVQTDTGPYDYNDVANWAGGVINGTFNQTLATDQTITFGTGTTLSNGLQFSLTGPGSLTLRSNGVASQTISLFSDLVLSGSANVVIGSHTPNHELDIDLGMAPRNIAVAAGQSLLVVNTINASTGGSVHKYGAGAMVMAGALNTMDPTTVWEGTLQFGDGTTNGSLLGGLVVKSEALANFYVDAGTSIIGSQISDAGAVVKEGNGILKFTTANTYTGGTTINSGTMIVANLVGSGTGTGTVTIGGSGKLQIGDGGTPNGSVAGDIQNLGGELVFKRPGSFTFSPKISGTGTVTVDGGYGSSVTLTGANDNEGWIRVLSGSLYDGASGTYSPAAGFTVGFNATIFVAYDETFSRLVDITPATAGTVSIGSTRTLTITTSMTDTFTGTITGGGALRLAATGSPSPGTQILAGSNDYTGGTIVQGGTLKVRNASGSATGTGSVTINPGAALQIGDSSSPGYGAVAGTIVNSGLLLIDRPDIYTFANPITGTGEVRFGYGSTRIVTLTGANTYTGNTVVIEGHVADGAAGAYSPGSSIGLNLGATLDVNFNETIAGLTAGPTGAGTVALANDAALTIDTSGAVTFGGAIAGSGSIVKAGIGTLTLSGSGTYIGSTIINDGALAIFSDNALGDSAATLVFGGGTLRFAAGASIYRNVSIGTAGGILDPQNYSTYLHGVISGGGALTKTGAGEVWLKGANTYTGGTAVAAGKLILANSVGSATGTGTVTVASGATLQVGSIDHPTWGTLSGDIANDGTVHFLRADTVSYGGVISGTGSLVSQGGTLSLTGTNTYTGGTTVTGGILKIASDASLGALNGPLALDGGTLHADGLNSTRAITLGTGGGTFDSGDLISGTDTTLSGVISGTGRLTLQGPGVLTLSGANNYAGGTTVQGGGVIDFTADANLGVTASSVTLNGGDLRTKAALTDFTHAIVLTGTGGINTYGYNSTFSGQISGTGSLAAKSQIGNGILTLTNATNQWAGATVIESGTLRIGATNALPASTTVQIAAGATLDISADQTLSGTLTGSGALTQSGTGELTLAGTSTFTGSAAIQSGKLTVAVTDAFTANDVNVATGAIFNVAENTTVGAIAGAGTTTVAAGRTLTLGSPQTLSAVISGDGSVAFNNAATMATSTITNDQTYAGATVVNSGTLEIGAGGTDGTTGSVAGDVLLNNGATLVFNRATAATSFAGTITGNGSLAKQGSGTLTLRGASTYSGSTVVKAGTVRLEVADALPVDTMLALSSGTLLELAANQTVAGFSESLGATIEVTAGQVFTVTLGEAVPVALFEGTIQGDGAFAVSPNPPNGYGVRLTGNNVYAGGTAIASGGTLRLGNAGTTGMVAGNIVNHGLLSFERTDGVTFGGVISGSGRVQQGALAGGAVADILTLSAANTYSGGTDVFTGGLRVANTSGSATGSGAVTIHDSGVLLGNGTIAGQLVVNAGATIVPGLGVTQPKLLTVGDTVFNPGGRFAFILSDATGTAGTDFGLLSISGTLTVLASSSEPFLVSVYSAGGGMIAPAINFDPLQAYSWTMISTTGGVTGFEPGAFQIDLTNFQNTFSGDFGLSLSAGSLLLSYSPAAVPEPSTWSLLVAGGAILAWLYRRRRR